MCWDIVDKEVVAFIQEFHKGGKLLGITDSYV